MDGQAKSGGEKLATAALFVIMFAIPLSRAAFQIVPVPPVNAVYFGYHAPILQALFILGVWRAGFLRQGAAHIPDLPRWLVVLVAVWLVFGTISAMISDFPLVSMVSEARWFMWAAFVYAALCFFGARPERCAWALDLYVAGFIGFSLILHFLVFANTDPDYSWVNGIPGFGNVRHFGFYAMSALAASMMPLFKAEFRWRSRQGSIQLLGVALCWTMLFWSGGRSPVLAILATIAIFAGWRLLPDIRRLAKLSLAAVGLAVPWSFLIAVNDEHLGLMRILGTFQRVGADAQSSGRLAIWRESTERIVDAPATGIGPGVFQQVMTDQWGHLLHPHNIVVQALLEWGFFGGLPFLLVLAALAIGALRGLKSYQHDDKPASDSRVADPAALAGALIGFTMLGASFLDGSLFLPFPLMVAAVGAAIYFSRHDLAPVSVRTSEMSGPVPRRLAVAGLSAAGVVTLVGVISSAVLGTPGTPPPDGLRVSTLKRFPVSMAGAAGILTYGRWTDEWAADIGPRALVAHLDWARSYAPGYDLKATLEARRACALGEREKATEALQRLSDSSFDFYGREQDRIRQRMAELWPACVALPAAVPKKR